ncbi:MAG: hypothetical protein NTW14_03235 [bacterium]|nr:hypothetical protein [bacterium]
MNPVFIRRGGVLFLIKSPADFLQNLQMGKIRPTDQLLVKDQSGLDWIPISAISQYRHLNNRQVAISTAKESSETHLLDHIRTPGFNMAAFLLGGFWYFTHNLPRLALKRLLPVLLSIAFVVCLGALHRLHSESVVPVVLLLWFSAASFIAFRADHDLNRTQVERFNGDAKSAQPTSPDIAFSAITTDAFPHYTCDYHTEKIYN